MCTTHSLEKARLSMARGICSEAVEALEAVVPFLSYGTVVGGTAFIELGMALEASGKPQKALDIYQKLAKQTGDEAIRKQAKQLEFGFEAMEFFGMDASASEAAKLAQRSVGSGPKLSNPTITNRAWSGEYFDKSYDSTYIFVTSDSKKKFRKQQAATLGSFREAWTTPTDAMPLAGVERASLLSSVL